jgi:hypothetical protein
MKISSHSIDPKYLEAMLKLTPEERLAVSCFFSSDFRIRTQEAFVKHFGDLGLQRWLEVFYDEKIARGVLGVQFQES